MYSGTTLTRMSGRMLGTHQKIDRIARKHLSKVLPDDRLFPSSRRIIHFEGFHGPDAIKRKSPAQDEPWHFFNPFDDSDSKLLVLIDEHFDNLVNELKSGNQERSAFEAAWLAHALVDGLTPAHHYPYEEGLKALSDGAPIEERSSVKKKIIMPGETTRQQVVNNWKAWGPKGLRTTHALFEIGVATLIAPLKFGDMSLTNQNYKQLTQHGVMPWFRNTAREVAVLDLYHSYIKKGWTPKLAWQIRHKLGPTLVESVALVWYAALVKAGLIKYENNLG